MPSLTHIATEAQRLLRSIRETRRRELQHELVALCENHWHEVRGLQPDTPLAQALWAITPPWSDLLLDCYASYDHRLTELLPSGNLSNGLALLALAEIERGNEMGAHIAHEPMMAFEEAAPSTAWLERIAKIVRGTLEPPLLHPHDRRDALWKALAVIAAHTRRLDPAAVLEVVRLLTDTTTQDAALERLRQDVLDVGIRFRSIEHDHIQFELHGHPHKPVRARQLGEMVLEIREKWLH
jgi:hypothetical protein